MRIADREKKITDKEKNSNQLFSANLIWTLISK